MTNRDTLLTDAEVMRFVNHGYHLVEPPLPPGLNESLYEACSRLEQNLGNGIYDAVPVLVAPAEPTVQLGLF